MACRARIPLKSEVQANKVYYSMPLSIELVFDINIPLSSKKYVSMKELDRLFTISAKRGKNCASPVTIDFGFVPDWLKESMFVLFVSLSFSFAFYSPFNTNRISTVEI